MNYQSNPIEIGRLCVGVMSGTSVDAVDAAMISIDAIGSIALVAAHQHNFDPTLRQTIMAVQGGAAMTASDYGALHVALGQCYVQAVGALIENASVLSSCLVGIGCHGQTLWHQPNGPNGFSLQLGDPNTLAAAFGCPVVCDFRQMDVVRGGQGAPLAPLFHRAFFAEPGDKRAVVNLGGIMNVSWFEGVQSPLLGFDVGPANCLLDAWIMYTQGAPYDAEGQWAKSGQVQTALLNRLRQDPFRDRPLPKSCGKEQYHLDWLVSMLPPGILAQDVQATLVEWMAENLASALTQLAQQGYETDAVYLCGGGVKNGALVDAITVRCASYQVATTQDLNLDPQWVEAAGFAWLADQRLRHQPLVTQSITGAVSSGQLGAIYQG